MTKSIVKLFFVVCFAYAILDLSLSAPIEKTDTKDTTRNNKDLKAKFLEELDEMDKEASQKLVDVIFSKPRNKRSDIDERLFELQAKILLTKAIANMAPGHGKFNFDKIGKRANNAIEYKIITPDEYIKKKKRSTN